MPWFKLMLVLGIASLVGCTNVERLGHSLSEQAPDPKIAEYKDRGTGVYYDFLTQPAVSQPDTYVFFYGSSGCGSWKYLMPNYVEGLTVPARVFALNKRFVSDRSTGLLKCGDAFHQMNYPDRWLEDFRSFVTFQLRNAPKKPKNVVLVGVSESAMTALKLANELPQVTHLAIIGEGGYSLRESMKILHDKGFIADNIEEGMTLMSKEPHSIHKSWHGHTYRWWNDVVDFDPLPYYLKRPIPILVGIGERDQRIPVESGYYLERAFKEKGQTNLTLKTYPGANHELKARDTSYLPDFFRTLSAMLN